LAGAGATPSTIRSRAVRPYRAVKALVGEVPSRGDCSFPMSENSPRHPEVGADAGRIEVEFPVVDGSMRNDPAFARFSQAWSRLVGQLRRARTCSPTFKTGGKIARHWPCSLRPAPPAIRREVAPPRRRYGADNRFIAPGLRSGADPRQQIGASVSSMRRSAGMWARPRAGSGRAARRSPSR